MSELAGRWVEPEVNYVDPDRRFCAYCGRPIARRFWEARVGEGEVAAYCSPEHAERKATYPTAAKTSDHGTNRTDSRGA